MSFSWSSWKLRVSDHLLKRVLFTVLAGLGIFHLLTLSQVPPVGVLEGWYADPAYCHYRFGKFDYTMFPGLVEFQNGAFGQGNLRFWLQSCSFKILGFGLFQSRLPMLFGGGVAVYFVFLTSRYLFGTVAGLFAALFFIASPTFYNSHQSDAHSWIAASFVLAVYFGLRLFSERKPVFAFLSGIAIGVSVSFHVVGVLGVIPLTFLMLYYHLTGKLDRLQLVFYFLGGLISFVIWYLLTVYPIGLSAFLMKSVYGVEVSRSGYIGSRWVHYFLRSGFGVVVEIPLLLIILSSYQHNRQETHTQFAYLFLGGLLVTYTLFVGSASLMPVWAVLFVVGSGLTARLLEPSANNRAVFARALIGVLALVFLYYANIQAKAAYAAACVKSGDRYAELTSQIAERIPEGKVVMGSPLYWFRFAGRNPYITQNFYWERMDAQTHELRITEPQPMPVRAQRMVAFLKRRNVEYFIADRYFQDAISPWIPEDQWKNFFSVLGEFQSSIYGGATGGDKPPYKVQVWCMREERPLQNRVTDAYMLD